MGYPDVGTCSLDDGSQMTQSPIAAMLSMNPFMLYLVALCGDDWARRGGISCVAHRARVSQLQLADR